MKAIFYLIIATFFWGLNFHLAKVMLKSIDFLEAGFWRYLIGVLFLLLLVNIRKLSALQILSKLKGISLVGLVGLFGFNLFFFWGMLHTTAVNAALIMSLNPALTLLLSYRILKTPLQAKAFLGIFIALGGVLYLMAKGEWANLLLIRFGMGDLLIIVANVLFALHHVWVKKYCRDMPVLQFTLLTNGLCLLCFLLIIPLAGAPDPLNYSLFFWLAAFGIGALGTGFAYFLWNRGVQEIGADKAGVFMNVVPLSAAVLAGFFGEALYPYHFVCGALILGGMLITLRPHTPNRPKKSFA